MRETIFIGTQNDERLIQNFLKKFAEFRLENVSLITNTILEIDFSETNNFHNCPKKFVRQYSRKKYVVLSDPLCYLKQLEKKHSWEVFRVITLPDKWLVFCRS